MQTRSIFLVRHGRPVFWDNHSYMELMNCSQYCKSLEEYDNSTIDVKELPITDDLLQAGNSDVFFTSNLLRSIDSGKLFKNSDSRIDVSLRETEIPRSTAPLIKMPVILWIFIQRLRWFMGNDKGCESFADFKKRAKGAAVFFDSAIEFKSITVVAHGFFNRYLAKYLADLKWRVDGKPDYNYWGLVKMRK